MKIKEISLNNFSKYDKVTVNFDENVTYLVGKNGSGKSTLGITGVQAIMQGIAEKASGGNQPVFGERFRFIGPKSASSTNTIVLIDEKCGGAEITVTRKITKTGSELSIIAPEDYGTLDQQWLNNLFNIFLIAPKKFCELSPKDQAKALGIDTKKFDEQIADLKKQYTEINAVIKSIGNIEPVAEVTEVDLSELTKKKEEVKTRLNNIYLENKAKNNELRSAYDAEKDKAQKEYEALQKDMEEKNDKVFKAESLLEVISKLGYTGAEVRQWIDSLPFVKEIIKREVVEPIYIEEVPDRSELDAIDQQIVAANETNQKALLYKQHLEKKKQKEAKEAELKANKDKQTVVENERIEYVKGFKFPFSNLSVGEDGELLLSGKPIKDPYFSTGELLKIIPVLISTTQPELKYVFLQDFNLLDDEKQTEIEQYLTEKGFQLVVEMVGKTKITDKNCILLRDNVVVESYEEADQKALL